MSRKAVAILILLVWFGALGWLAQRRTVGIHSGVIVRTWPVSPGASFFGVYRGDKQVGMCRARATQFAAPPLFLESFRALATGA